MNFKNFAWSDPEDPEEDHCHRSKTPWEVAPLEAYRKVLQIDNHPVGTDIKWDEYYPEKDRRISQNEFSAIFQIAGLSEKREDIFISI